MSFLTPKLKRRIEIQRVKSLDPFESGALENNYETIATIWAQIKSLSDYVKAIRGQNTSTSLETHIFIVRKASVKSLGVSNSDAFSIDFDTNADINSIKSEYFIFLKKGETGRGRRFKVMGTFLDEVNQEFVKVEATEIEEVGTGHGGSSGG